MTALAQAELEAVFAAELATLGPRPRRELVEALQGVSIWAFWDSLRSDLGLSPRQARDTLARVLLALLAQAGFTS